MVTDVCVMDVDCSLVNAMQILCVVVDEGRMMLLLKVQEAQPPRTRK